ncbi:MAG TPA: Stk1 family PASTA domain-containing Ser/Thr kinase [Cellulomonas sp.]|uniref:Stk1 family PASTA domain-containing Ser/Thr kinase n=1 Tax=Cellulomonas sp. TaxID=40001 RepID=UPI002E2FE3D1|nr:Stk1 family PASTA domain-containing Ser/Thr kinase [Cellulomonas sp.]HEX5334096.1 Stk1 family PASTA domain-containing Ser/Thr kinase [Cellulomonas sp.]
MGTTVTDPLVGRLVDGRYEVMSRIARGGMATVYLAIDRRLDREVALKVMHPHLAAGTDGSDFVARFRREARAAARLTHPGLVGVYDQGLDGETSYLTMEYIDGTNLRRHLSEQGSLTVGAALDLIDRVLDALAVAHRAGLVHRDIKPENVLIAADSRVKVADFGLARAVTEVTSAMTGTVFGTVAYLAPELVARGSSDARTDVYAAGILLYEMITGRQPFVGETPIQVAFQHVNTDIPAASDLVHWLPVEIDELIGALAAREPDDRPTDASAALALVRRTRGALDPETLARRADVSPSISLPLATDAGDDLPDDDVPGSALVGPTRLDDDQDPPPTGPDAETTRFAVVPAGGTVALPIGTGISPPADKPTPSRRRRRVIWASVVALLLVGLGGGAWWYVTEGPGAYTTVPQVAGEAQDVATTILTAHGLTADPVQAFDHTVASGFVVGTTPAEGSHIRKDGTVTVTVSKGQDLVAVPDKLVGAMQADAEAALTAAGLTATYVEGKHYSDTAQLGAVIESSAKPGDQVERSSEVQLTVSDGPAPVTIVSVVGATQDEASKQLESIGLKVALAPAFSDTVAQGRVISQDPLPQAEGHHRGDTVTLTISQGPELFDVPDVNRQGIAAATKTLEDAGFKVKTQRATAYFGLGFVVGQDPPGGVKVAPKGATITLTIT